MSSEKAIAIQIGTRYLVAMDGYIQTVLGRVQRSDLSESELCRRAGIANSTWVRIKQGQSSPTIRTMDKIERVLDEQEAAMPRAGESPAQ